MQLLGIAKIKITEAGYGICQSDVKPTISDDTVIDVNTNYLAEHDDRAGFFSMYVDCFNRIGDTTLKRGIGF